MLFRRIRIRLDVLLSIGGGYTLIDRGTTTAISSQHPQRLQSLCRCAYQKISSIFISDEQALHVTFHSCFERIVDGASVSGQGWSVHGYEEEKLTGIRSV